MARRSPTNVLRQMASIRALQEYAAAANAAAAGRRLRTSTSDAEQASRMVRGAEDAWHRAHEAASLDLGTLLAWSREVRAKDNVLTLAEADRGHARRRCETALAASDRAAAFKTTADDQVRRGQNADARRLDEMSAAEALALHAMRKIRA